MTASTAEGVEAGGRILRAGGNAWMPPLLPSWGRGRFHAESRRLVTLESGRWSRAVEDALRSEFDVVEEEGPQSYYGPLTAIRRELNGAVELGLDDRWRGYGAIVP